MLRRAFFFGLAILVTAGLAACGGESQSAASDPSGSGGSTGSQDQTVTITPVGNQMQYEQTEIRAPAGSEIRIVFANTADSPAMHHNVVVLAVQDPGLVDSVGQAALTAKDNDYIPPAYTDQIRAHTSMAAPGDTVSVTFTVPEETGEYPYVCTYPGHYQTMRGTLIAE